MRRSKRVISLLLCLVMIFTLIPDNFVKAGITDTGVSHPISGGSSSIAKTSKGDEPPLNSFAGVMLGIIEVDNNLKHNNKDKGNEKLYGDTFASKYKDLVANSEFDGIIKENGQCIGAVLTQYMYKYPDVMDSTQAWSDGKTETDKRCLIRFYQSKYRTKGYTVYQASKDGENMSAFPARQVYNTHCDSDRTKSDEYWDGSKITSSFKFGTLCNNDKLFYKIPLAGPGVLFILLKLHKSVDFGKFLC